MASKVDLGRAQDKLRLRSELLALKVKKVDINSKIADVQGRLRRMGGR